MPVERESSVGMRAKGEEKRRTIEMELYEVQPSQKKLMANRGAAQRRGLRRYSGGTGRGEMRWCSRM